MSRPIFTGTAGGVDINTESIGRDGTNYGVGFGPGDLRRVTQGGYSAQSVLDYLSTWNNPISSDARAGLTQLAAQQRAADTDAIIERARAYSPPAPPPAPVINIPPPPPTVPAPMSISGNTAGVKRKKSRAEQTGRTSSGTNQFNRSMYISPVAPLSNINV